MILKTIIFSLVSSLTFAAVIGGGTIPTAPVMPMIPAAKHGVDCQAKLIDNESG